MDIASSLLEIGKGLWGSASRPLGYIYNLKDNVRSLNEANEDLKAVSEDVKARVEREEEEARARRTNQVANWLGNVQQFVGAVDQVLGEAEEHGRIKFLGRCLPPNCRSRYKLGKRVYHMLNQASKLRSMKGEFDAVTLPLSPPRVLEMPMDKAVGIDISFNKVWKWLVDEKQVGVVGLFGIGGVGKTTLMKRINEELSRANYGFDVVIWVVVSRQLNEDSIQDTIRRRVNIQDGSWEGRSWDERVHHLWNVLKQKKFVLLIDDVWARLDLPKIGVPRPSLVNGSKVVFTTRSEQVCDQMAVDRTIEIQCLTSEGALELFEKSVGKSTVHSHRDILEYAEKIVRECKGLPLALITVGRVMAGRRNPREWEHALTTLRNNPYKLSGKVEEMYYILAFSYDSLNDSAQRCFIYCCLFPEDYLIIIEELIKLWMGEGLLKDTNDPYSMQLEGEFVLEDLKKACLLESEANYVGQQCVKMHDVIRDMATWIARDYGKRENNLLVIEKDEDLSPAKISKWGNAKKVSLWGERIQNINHIPPRCSQLETLIVRGTYLHIMPRGFFDLMDARLTVLDLSNNKGIQSFPEDICNLIHLQYLNLSHTCIRELPMDINKLTHLQLLLLEYLKKGILIPIGAIASLPLIVLSLWDSQLEEEEEMVEELGRMQHLANLSIQVRKSSSVHKIFQSSNLQRSIRRVRIENCPDLTCIVVSHSLLHLELLELYDCDELVQMEIRDGIGRAPDCSCFPSLIEVVIIKCRFSDLSWLVHVPKLRTLFVIDCPSMEKIIGDGFASEELTVLRLFSRLEFVRLWTLPKLTSICDEALSFPQGVMFDIKKCPGLRKLPIDSSSARGGGFLVRGDKEWWAGFEWDPAPRVTLRMNWDAVEEEEMTYGEARRRVEDDAKPYASPNMRFLPDGQSE